MDVINEYNILSEISSIEKKIYQPHYSSTNIKIFHNKNEILLHYDKKENIFIEKNKLKPKSKSKSKLKPKSKKK